MIAERIAEYGVFDGCIMPIIVVVILAWLFYTMGVGSGRSTHAARVTSRSLITGQSPDGTILKVSAPNTHSLVSGICQHYSIVGDGHGNFYLCEDFEKAKSAARGEETIGSGVYVGKHFVPDTGGSILASIVNGHSHNFIQD